MSILIVDSDTLNISSIEDEHNLTGPPPTSTRITTDYHEALTNGNNSGAQARVTIEYNETLANGHPYAKITQQFWETLVSVNHSTFLQPDTLDLEFTEVISKLIKDVDSLDLSLEDSVPGYVSDVHPTVIPIEQTFVLLYVIGFGFTESAQIVFNGQTVATTYVSPMELTAKIPPSIIAPLGTIEVYVTE